MQRLKEIKDSITYNSTLWEYGSPDSSNFFGNIAFKLQTDHEYSNAIYLYNFTYLSKMCLTAFIFSMSMCQREKSYHWTHFTGIRTPWPGIVSVLPKVLQMGPGLHNIQAPYIPRFNLNTLHIRTGVIFLKLSFYKKKDGPKNPQHIRVKEGTRRETLWLSISRSVH